jgi:hypothetical protein
MRDYFLTCDYGVDLKDASHDEDKTGGSGTRSPTRNFVFPLLRAFAPPRETFPVSSLIFCRNARAAPAGQTIPDSFPFIIFHSSFFLCIPSPASSPLSDFRTRFLRCRLRSDRWWSRPELGMDFPVGGSWD